MSVRHSTTVYGVPDPEIHQEVICRKYGCNHVQWEHKPKAGDKSAWSCRRCGTINEGDKIHLLHKNALWDGTSPI